MCVAELNVSVLPCRHRWYHLSRPCSPSTNLQNCPRRLALSGWEIKCDFCPYCAGWNLSGSEYRLVGNDRPRAVEAVSRMPSLTLSTTRQETRVGSLSKSDSNSSITVMAQEKNRAMNARVDAYVKGSIDAVLLPPPYPGSLPEAAAAAAADDDDDDDDANTTSSPSDTCSEGPDSLRHSSTSTASSSTDRPGLFKKMRRRSKKLSFGFFK